MAASGKKFEVDPELEAIIQVHIHADERIHSIYRAAHLSDEVSVHLIRQSLHDKLQQAKVPRIRNGGCGRVLSFERKEGKWHFLGEGGWIA